MTSPDPISPETPLRRWLPYWIDCYASQRCKSEVTLERYRSLAGYLVRSATPELREVSETSLANVTHLALETALLGLLRSPSQRKKNLSVRTLRHFAALLGVALAKAARLELIPSNPMLKVELPSAPRPQTRSLSVEELGRLLGACRGDWTYSFVTLAMATGLRRGELLALAYSDINYYTCRLSIMRSLEETRKGLRIKSTKNGRPRSCTLPQSAMHLFPRFNSRGVMNEGLLFPDELGGWRRPAYVSQIIVRRMKKAGIENASLHTLRHTHGSQLLSRGLPVPAVSARLGHCDPAVTLKIYGHALPADDQRVADEWDRVVAGLC